MTNEEAIKIIKEIEYPVNGNNKKERDEAIDIAIKALEQQTCEDCVSRQAVIDEIKKNTFRLKFAEERGDGNHVAWSAKAVYSDAIYESLLELPSVTPHTVESKEQININELQEKIRKLQVDSIKLMAENRRLKKKLEKKQEKNSPCDNSSYDNLSQKDIDTWGGFLG